MIPRLLWPLLTPVRSAPSCGGGYPSRAGPHRSPRVPHVSFPPSTRHIYSTHFRVVIGLRLVQQSCPCVKPQMCFLYVGPEVCPRVSIFPESSFLQIPPHGGHPCFRLYPSHYRADSGLSPVRNVRRRAHYPTSRRISILLLAQATPLSSQVLRTFDDSCRHMSVSPCKHGRHPVARSHTKRDLRPLQLHGLE